MKILNIGTDLNKHFFIRGIVYRNSGYGFACAFAGIGGALAPFANTFVSVYTIKSM